MKGSVLEQRYNGIKISEKTKIQWGSRITLVIGAGTENEQMPVPTLIGMTYIVKQKLILKKVALVLAQ